MEFVEWYIHECFAVQTKAKNNLNQVDILTTWRLMKIFIFPASWLETCEFKDPEFFKCSTRSVHGLFQHLLGGIEGVEGLDSIDPMIIDRIRILQGEGPVSVNASLSKVKVIGFSKVKVVENQVSSKDYSWVTTIKLPKMRLEGNYHMMGRILVIPLNVSFISSVICKSFSNLSLSGSRQMLVWTMWVMTAYFHWTLK